MFRPENYSPYWQQFSRHIRFDRAKARCECLGECGRQHGDRCAAVNGGIGKMGLDGVWRTEDAIHSLNSAEGLALYPSRNFIGTKVCLTTAHLDFSGGICDCKSRYGFKCAKPSHVLALCNFCHLSLDRDSHTKKRATNAIAAKDAERGLLLLTV